MHQAGMTKMAATGVVVFLDVQQEDILKRLEKMKVNRIVGQGGGSSMADILKFRQQFYNKYYDIRIICYEHEPPESVADKVCQALTQLADSKTYVSTQSSRNDGVNKGFNDVVLEGLAADGGLYVPAGGIPQLSLQDWSRLIPLSYLERALLILEKWIHPWQLQPSRLRQMVYEAYGDNFQSTYICPVYDLGDDCYMSELFHGPTASFKDAALQLMPCFFQHAIDEIRETDRYLVLVATSGDTGGAVLDGFARQTNSKVRVMVLYPEDGISPIQKAQMTAAGGDNVTVIGVKSDFDFCQSSIKEIFSDTKMKYQLLESSGVKLSAANSINWGRLLPQVVYHCSAYLDLVAQGVIKMGDQADLCIPTGNFGNILAAYYAKEMGIPFKWLICASNVNNVLSDFFNTGVYDLRHRSLKVTSAPAIDILKSSNLERYLYHKSDGNGSLIRGLYDDLKQHGIFRISKELQDRVDDILSGWCSEEESLAEVARTYTTNGVLLDPHTAVARAVARKFKSQKRPMLIAATAHPAKFAADVLKALGHPANHSDDSLMLINQLESIGSKPEMHSTLKNTLKQPRRHWKVIDADQNQIKKEIFSAVQSL